LPADLYFWRDNHGLEVDLVFEHQGRLHSVECKSGTTYASDALAAARRWRQAAGETAAPPVLLYGGDTSFVQADHRVLSWRDLGLPVASRPCPRPPHPPSGTAWSYSWP